eukprot:TRINITY_DN43094_c0_g1_i1.p1 TRINITY_DN43094_c0_g1~~TRINITY_DN43094_c0_g1_i1.p1  ORF type:complete len:318 (+),score=98.26 TRINITY_DN43094_c0_g1_i1:131-955(+)
MMVCKSTGIQCERLTWSERRKEEGSKSELTQLEEECQDLVERRLAIEEELSRRSKTGMAVAEHLAATLEKSRAQLKLRVAAELRQQEECRRLTEKIAQLRAEEVARSAEVQFLELSHAGQRAQLAEAERRLKALEQRKAETSEEEASAMNSLRQKRNELEHHGAELRDKAEHWQRLLDFRAQRAEHYEERATELELLCEHLAFKAAEFRREAAEAASATDSHSSGEDPQGLDRSLASADQEVRMMMRVRQMAFVAPIISSLLASLWWQVTLLSH